jgi:hypothetical protein
MDNFARVRPKVGRARLMLQSPLHAAQKCKKSAASCGLNAGSAATEAYALRAE